MNRIIMIPALINSVTLLIISAIHIYWSAGGRWGHRAAIPERNGTQAFQPGRVATFVVAVMLGGMAFFYLDKAGWLSPTDIRLPDWLNQYGLWLLAGIFFLRAIGDFRYVGFFKQIRNSRFAQLDTRFYSPLCLLLSINTLVTIILL